LAVYTDITEDDLSGFLKQYDVGTLTSYKGIAEGVENTNFLLHTTKGSYILTLYEKRVDQNDLPFFPRADAPPRRQGAVLPAAFAAPTANCSAPVRPPGRRYLVPGRHVAAQARCQPLPRSRQGAGAMHVAGEGFEIRRPNALSVGGWRPLWNNSRDRADEVQPGLQTEIATELDFLEANWPKDLPEGVIHADLFPDNVFFPRR
jgi:homoserine kinase type II